LLLDSLNEYSKMAVYILPFLYKIVAVFYPLSTTDEYFEVPYEEYPITICGQTVILTNGELSAALFKFLFDEQEVRKVAFITRKTDT
jgi:hypothetical protein